MPAQAHKIMNRQSSTFINKTTYFLQLLHNLKGLFCFKSGTILACLFVLLLCANFKQDRYLTSEFSVMATAAFIDFFENIELTQNY